MPQAKNANAAGLDIVLDQPAGQIYYPGHTISGKVCLSAVSDVSIGIINITFYGRSKVKIIQSHGESESVYRSRANFFHLNTELFKSTHTYKAGSWEWPFSFTCPHIADEVVLKDTTKPLKGTKFRASNTFLDFEGLAETASAIDLGKNMKVEANVGILGHDLPPAMRYYHGMLGRRSFGYVEYVLEAAMIETEDKRRLFGTRAPKRHETTRLINFAPGKKQDVLKQEQLNMQEERFSLIVNALTFGGLKPLPELSATTSYGSDNPIHMTPSKIEKVRSLFPRLSLNPNLSSVSGARLGLEVKVTYPRSLQVHHPDTIPFLITVKPDLAFGAGADLSHLPATIIKTFTFHVICCTRVRAPGTFSDHPDSKTVAIKLSDDLQVNHRIELAPRALSRVQDEKQDLMSGLLQRSQFSNSIDPLPVDVGRLASLRLRSGQIGKIYEPILVPTVKTYNIKREFGLKWEVGIQVEGTTRIERIRGEVPKGEMTIVGIADAIRNSLGSSGLGDVDVEQISGKDVDGGDGREKAGRWSRKQDQFSTDDKKKPMKLQNDEDEDSPPRYEV